MCQNVIGTVEPVHSYKTQIRMSGTAVSRTEVVKHEWGVLKAWLYGLRLKAEGQEALAHTKQY